MEILECWLKNYGKFSDYRLKFHAGLNVVEGGNESGKSTVFSFIRAMLYGIARNRSKNLDEYQLRKPWNNPDFFAGTMRVLFEGRIYRIERNFLKKDESLSVVCETEGLEMDDPEAFLRRLTGGLTETDFLNTFYIRQAQAETDAQLGTDLRNYLVNMEQAGNASTDVSAAMEILKKKRRELETDRKKQLDAVERQIDENRRESEYVRSEMERLADRMKEGPKAGGEATFQRKAAGAGGQPEKVSADGTVPGTCEGSGQTVAAAGKTAVPGTQRVPDTYDSAGDSFRTGSTGHLPKVLALLLLAVGVLAGLCGFFASNHTMEVLLLALGGIVIIVSILMLAALSQRKPYMQAEREKESASQANSAREGDSVLHRESEVLDEKSRRKLKKAERSVKRYSTMNKLLGFRDDSVDPELEARKRRLQRQQEKTLEEEEQIARQRMAADVARIMESQKKDRAADISEGGTPEGNADSGVHSDRHLQDLSSAAASGRAEALAREIREKQMRQCQLQTEFAKLSEKKEGLTKNTLDLEAVDLALDRISRLSSSIYHETGEQFSARVSGLLDRMTGGRYQSISMNEKMEVVINTPDRLLKLQQVSYGTMNQIYFALRIASGELLSGGADLPLLLDEPFAMYDDARLKDALKFLAGYGHQIILFTCQGREKRLAAEI